VTFQANSTVTGETTYIITGMQRTEPRTLYVQFALFPS